MPKVSLFDRRVRATAALALLLVVSAPALGNDRDKAPAPVAKVRPFAVHHPLPFKFGERLVFDVKFSRFPISANVGELTFTVSEIPGSDQHVKFQAFAVSKGALVSLFGVKVNDTFTSLADRNDLAVYSTLKQLNEGEYRAHEQAVFDRGASKVRFKRVVFSQPGDQPVEVEHETRPWVQDMVSAVYFARTRRLKNVGREVRFPISDRGETRDITIALAGRERVKTDVGTFDALKVDVKIFDGRLVNREGELYVWLTDDARRIPIKAEMKIPAGNVAFALTSLGEGTAEIVSTAPPGDQPSDDE
jgi:hypothetical protein